MKLNFDYQGYTDMIVCSPISTCANSVVCLSSNIQTQMGSKMCSVISRRPSSSKYAHFPVSKNCTSVTTQPFHRSYAVSCFPKERGKLWSLTIKDLVSTGGSYRKQLNISLASHGIRTSVSMRKQTMLPKINCSVRQISWPLGCATAGLISGLFVCYSSSEPVHAEGAQGKEDKEDDCDSSYVKMAHGKKVYTDYSIIGIPGDGRCLFRSVAHGACVRSGRPAPSESVQRELADDLRARVAEEFIKRREETEWFVEGDFDTYVKQIRKPHVWGGEPELFMASHVLQMPITVYMYDRDAGGLISIAEYGEEYGKDNPIKVLYHGFGHYDALKIPGKNGGKSRL
ncbi:hypothetical protein UlMin_005225 [Ulmus minor]